MFINNIQVMQRVAPASQTNTMAQVEANNVTVSQGFRMLFSLMTPEESSFATVEEVPKYVNQVSVTSLQSLGKFRIHDSNTSVCLFS